jgi:flagellar biosynthesis protein FlhG
MTRHARQGEGVFRRLQRVTDRYLEVGLDFVGEIPEDGALQQAVQAQRPVLEAFPMSPAARAFERLASVATRWPVPAGASGRLEFFLERMLRRPAARLKVLK